MGPRVSVLIPVLNGETFIAAAIRSILAQSYRDFELLVLDDGSTDNTGLVVTSFKDQRIKYIQGGRRGLAHTLNHGISIASGCLIARQDADDLSREHRLKRQVEYFDSNPECALLGTWASIVNEHGLPIGAHRHPVRDKELRLALCLGNPFVHTSVMFPKDLACHIGGYPTESRWTPPEDYGMWTKLCQMGTIANISEELVVYCERGSGVSQTKKQEIHCNSIRIADSYIEQMFGSSLTKSQAQSLASLFFGGRVQDCPEKWHLLFRWPYLLLGENDMHDTSLRRLVDYYWLRTLLMQLPGKKIVRSLLRNIKRASCMTRGKENTITFRDHVEDESISVIISTYQRPALLRQAIESIISQIHNVEEIIICEDGKSKECADVICSFNDPRIRYLAGNHAGLPAVPRNRGIFAAKSKWLAFLDDDDSWHPEKIKAQLDVVRQHHADFVAERSSRTVAGPNQTSIQRLSFFDLLRGNPIVLSSVLIKKSILKTGFSESTALRGLEDYHLWLQVLTATDCILMGASYVDYENNSVDSIRLSKKRRSGIEELSSVLSLLLVDHGNVCRMPTQMRIAVIYRLALNRAKSFILKVVLG